MRILEYYIGFAAGVLVTLGLLWLSRPPSGRGYSGGRGTVSSRPPGAARRSRFRPIEPNEILVLFKPKADSPEIARAKVLKIVEPSMRIAKIDYEVWPPEKFR